MQTLTDIPKSQKFIPQEESMQFFYTAVTSIGSSKREGSEVQDTVSKGFVGDGISLYPESKKDSDFAAKVYAKLFRTNVDGRAAVKSKIEQFKTIISAYCLKEGIEKFRSTFSYIIPFKEDGNTMLCSVSQGDSTIYGLTTEGKLQQLNINSHPLFSDVAQNGDEVQKKFAINLQQCLKDNRLKYKGSYSNTNQVTIEELKEIYGDEFEDRIQIFLKSAVIGAKIMIPKVQSMLKLTSYRNNLLENEQTEGTKREIKKANLILEKYRITDDFIQNPTIEKAIALYHATINTVSDYQTEEYYPMMNFKYVLVASDGMHDNLNLNQITKILTESGVPDQVKNDKLVSSAIKAGNKPDDVASFLLKII
jgi:serine/threonine protein phosphatase PrpC